MYLITCVTRIHGYCSKNIQYKCSISVFFNCMSIAFRPIQMTDEYEYVHILLLVLHIVCICFDVFVAISLIPFPLQLFLFLPSALALFCFIHPNMYLSISFAHAFSLSLHPIHIVHICSFKMILYFFLLYEAIRNVRCV